MAHERRIQFSLRTLLGVCVVITVLVALGTAILRAKWAEERERRWRRQICDDLELAIQGVDVATVRTTVAAAPWSLNDCEVGIFRRRPLIAAIEAEEPRLVKALLELSPKPLEPDPENGLSPIHFLVQFAWSQGRARFRDKMKHSRRAVDDQKKPEDENSP